MNDFRYRLKQKAVHYKGGKCNMCGYNNEMKALQFHHTDSKAKDFAISQVKSSSWDNIKIELDKCILLCANCHSEIHAKEINEENEKIRNITISLRERVKDTRICERCKTEFKIHKHYESKFCNSCRYINTPKFTVANKLPERSVLEQLVWKKSLTVIGEMFNCSPQSVKKYCVKNDVQLPPRNYWSSRVCEYVIDWPTDTKLAKLVFTKPLIHLAKDLGVSDNAIKKRCKRKNIKLPGRGYWLLKRNAKYHNKT